MFGGWKYIEIEIKARKEFIIFMIQFQINSNRHMSIKIVNIPGNTTKFVQDKQSCS